MAKFYNCGSRSLAQLVNRSSYRSPVNRPVTGQPVTGQPVIQLIGHPVSQSTGHLTGHRLPSQSTGHRSTGHGLTGFTINRPPDQPVNRSSLSNRLPVARSSHRSLVNRSVDRSPVNRSPVNQPGICPYRQRVNREPTDQPFNRPTTERVSFSSSSQQARHEDLTASCWRPTVREELFPPGGHATKITTPTRLMHIGEPMPDNLATGNRFFR